MEYKKFNRYSYKKGAIDLTGQVFGRLKVVGVYGVIRRGLWWVCECECGNYKNVSSSRLRNGVTKSCGCYAVDNPSRKTHHMSKTSIYRVQPVSEGK